MSFGNRLFNLLRPSRQKSNTDKSDSSVLTKHATAKESGTGQGTGKRAAKR